MKIQRLSGLLLACAVLLPGCGMQSYDIDGEFTLFASTEGPATNCYGTGGFSDISQGLSVTVRNESGTILATDRLGPGRRVGNRCAFTFTVTGIAKSDFYSIEVGRRGDLTYSHDEMVRNEWRVAASLGG